MRHHTILLLLFLFSLIVVDTLGQEQPSKSSNEIVEYKSEKLKKEQLTFKRNEIIEEQQLTFKDELNLSIIESVGLIFLLSGVSMLFYQKENLQNRLRINILEQEVLKAQINPHFFFNVLNALQGIALSGKPMLAYQYHTKFTQLMRLILNQWGQEKITLGEEIKFLYLYLELEQLRTGNAFEFEIINKIEPKKDLLVPSLLLQPFVENAIWDGVMNRKREATKKITINVYYKDNRIIYQIYDTGVGRKEAQKIKIQKVNKHKSMGKRTTQNRLELFQLRSKKRLSYKIQDLVSAEGVILGTKVELKIPNME